MPEMCCVKIICRILVNLFGRLGSEVLDCAYASCCCCSRNDEVQNCDFELIRETSESFYKNVDRQTAEELLKNKQDGTFVIRPSRRSKLGTLSVVQDGRTFHLTVRLRDRDGLIALGKEKENEKCFASVNGLINYYVSNYLILCADGVRTLTLLLPYRD